MVCARRGERGRGRPRRRAAPPAPTRPAPPPASPPGPRPPPTRPPTPRPTPQTSPGVVFSPFTLVVAGGGGVFKRHGPNPAPSSEVHRLEAETGTRLFDRNTRNVVLTPAGSELLAIADGLLNDFDFALSRVRDYLDGKRGRIRRRPQCCGPVQRNRSSRITELATGAGRPRSAMTRLTAARAGAVPSRAWPNATLATRIPPSRVHPPSDPSLIHLFPCRERARLDVVVCRAF